MKTAVVILNWNGKEFLSRFMPCLIENTPVDVTIVVADNASADDSVSFLREHFPQVQLVLNDRNYGFAGGYNVALKQVDADLFILLNSDVEVTTGWAMPLIEALSSNAQMAAVQPRIRDYYNRPYFEYAGAAGGWMDKDYYAFCRGRVFHSLEEDHGQYADNCEIYWATGACFAVKADLFFKAGGFDEDFFAHMEEIDLCARLKNMGYAIGYVGSSIVYHVGGGTLSKVSPYKTFLNYRNNLAMITKNHFTSPLASKLLRRMVFDGISCLQKIQKGEFRNTIAVIRAHFAFYGMLPSLLQKRRMIRKQRNQPNTAGIYPKSLLWQYFVRRNTTFSSLEDISKTS